VEILIHVLKTYKWDFNHWLKVGNKRVENNHQWKPYSDAINWFKDLSFVSKSLIAESGKLLDVTNYNEKTINSAVDSLQRDFSKE